MLNLFNNCLYVRRFISSIVLLCCLSPWPLLAFDDLTPAQAWIYDRSHLANTIDGQSLDYAYTGKDDDNPEVTDKASLSIIASHQNDRRDVEVDFLSGERQMALPVFKGYRGNPVIIAMLEHIAQSMSAQTGGGTLYFRNRIRDALASKDAELVENSAVYKDQEFDAIALTVYPFTNDQYLGISPYLKKTRISIQMSDEIPGGLLSVNVSARDGDRMFERNLALQ